MPKNVKAIQDAPSPNSVTTKVMFGSFVILFIISTQFSHCPSSTLMFYGRTKNPCIDSKWKNKHL